MLSSSIFFYHFSKKNGWEYSYPFFLRLIATCTCCMKDLSFIEVLLFPAAFLKPLEPTLDFNSFRHTLADESQYQVSGTVRHVHILLIEHHRLQLIEKKVATFYSAKLLDEFTLSFLEKILSQFIF